MIEQFVETIKKAGRDNNKVQIVGSGSKDFFAHKLLGEKISTQKFSGIVNYEPSELVIIVKAGTQLNIIESELKKNNQMLIFEPPYFSDETTIGGVVAAGFSGPRRAYSGSVRDSILGVKIIDHEGEQLRFGGNVMKNVAGYDVSRFMAGSFGTLGLITEISIKVLPMPESEITIVLDLKENDAIIKINKLASTSIPLSATCFYANKLYIRLSGFQDILEKTYKNIGGEKVNCSKFWNSIKNQTHDFFKTKNLWRLSVKSNTKPLNLGETLHEWNSSLRWCNGEGLNENDMHNTAEKAFGHATHFRAAAGYVSSLKLNSALLALHKRIKNSLDPNNIFGVNRIHSDF